MKPNFTDNSCEMNFGIMPPLESNDPAYTEKCYSTCSLPKLKIELK